MTTEPLGNRSQAQPLLYSQLAEWFHLLTRPEDYAEEAAIYSRIFAEAVPGARTLLELGSGGGNNASHMKRRFEMTLTDLSPAMLAVSRRLNPELEHIAGDMRTLRLGRTYDAVFIHDAVSYLTTEESVEHALRTAYAHTRPGGAVLVVPDHTKESFKGGSDVGGHDGENVTPPQPGRALRYMEWTYDPDPTDCTYIMDFAYLLKEGKQEVQCYYDRHVMGLFAQETWLRLLEAADFWPSIIPFDHSEVAEGAVLFLGVRT